MKRGGRFTGKIGKHFVNLRVRGGLGFKELAKFNDVMLAKQLRRLIHDTNSLFYRF